MNGEQVHSFEKTTMPPLYLTERQMQLCQLLDHEDDSRYQLEYFYRGAIRVLSDPHNSDCIHQAAHSLRELIEKLPMIKLRVSYEEIKGSQRDIIQETIEIIDPLSYNLGSEFRGNRARLLKNLRERFVNVCHHNEKPTLRKFEKYVHELEDLLISLFAPVTTEDHKKIKRIVSLSNRTENNEKNILTLIENKGTNFVFFFNLITKKEDTTWFSF